MSRGAYPDIVTRRFITASVMAASVMSALDSTIANVALPHMQGSVSASQDEITWVLTSYIVATAIVIPLSGWLADRFGRTRLLLVSVVGFTVASALCGIATNLSELVGFRVLQGICGAALVPMSQAILLDINPPERHGQAMAVWGMGVILGPVIGPVLGGWLTDNLSWRWVFYVNVPVGILTFVGLSLFLKETRTEHKAKLDLFGFALLALAVGVFQLMLDRGQQQDWFSSTEICVEAALSLFFFYTFAVHTVTARKPFVSPALFRDRNFLLGALVGLFVGIILFSVLALLPAMLQRLMGYPVVVTGLVTMPRGIGTLISMSLVGMLLKRIDERILMATGFVLNGISMYMMAGFSLVMGPSLVIVSGVIGGLGTGLIFVPLSTIAFSTLDLRYRNEAAAMFTLIRNIGSAVGISLMQVLTVRNAATVHARLTEGIRPDNPVMALRLPDFDFTARADVAGLNAEIGRQAGMVSYIDGYWAMLIVILCVTPVLLLMRPRRRKPGEAPLNVHLD